LWYGREQEYTPTMQPAYLEKTAYDPSALKDFLGRLTVR
jgi:hypothetical protein